MQMDIPQISFITGLLYSGFFAVGSAGMLYINFKWFGQLISRAKDMVTRVQKGESPTPDYDRPTKPAQTREKAAKKGN